MRAELPKEPPFAPKDAEVGRLWAEGLELERADRYLESALKWEKVVELQPDAAHVYWRIARHYVRVGGEIPIEAEQRRLDTFALGESWGKRGAEIDPGCAECVIYQFVGLTRVATTRGILESAGRASEMAGLLERAFELGPTYKDDRNDELANLYYAAGIFYRSVPEGVIGWAIGVQGDRRRAIDYVKKAVEVSPNRIDYRVELGVQLLCLGSKESDDALIAEGKAALASVRDLPTLRKTDPIDREHARLLAADTDEACGYGREEWLAEGKGAAK